MSKRIYWELTNKLHATLSPINKHSVLADNAYEVKINDVTFQLLHGDSEDEDGLFIHYDFGHSLVELKTQLLRALEKTKPDPTCEPHTGTENISFRTRISLSESTSKSVLSTLRGICESVELWRKAYIAAAADAYSARRYSVIH